MKTWLHFFLLLVTLWVSIIIIIPLVHSNCIPDQQQSLLEFKSNLLFSSSLFSKLITWNSSTDCCSWVGVTCSTNGRVLGLDLSNESISGGIDNSSSLFHLQNLQSLNLAYNELGNGSSIPSAVGQLMNLRYLNLSNNAYSGKIPIEISRLTKLVVLDISRLTMLISANYFWSEEFHWEVRLLEISNLHMMVENLTELRELYLDDVQISAEGSEWCQAISSSLPNLRVLSLFGCNLSGPFHESLANLRSLSVIQLGSNNISAPVPAFFANFSNLTSLSLDGCNLQGTFPKEIFQLPSLREIVLSGNEKLDGSLLEFPKNGSLQYLDLSGTNFSGALPNSIGNLKMLSTIDITACNFTGSIPKSMTNLSQLVYLLMNGNHFEGSIPSLSGAKNLEEIDLGSNDLTGNINCIHRANLTNLSSLFLAGNMLDGNIPSALFSLPLLDTLYLSDNQFFGHFPEISNLSSYSVKLLYLSGNNLEGPIPMSIFNLRSLTDLHLSSNNFSGSFPLDGLQNLRDLSYLHLSSNNFSGSFPLDGLQNLRDLSYLHLSHNSLLLSHDATNLSYSYFPQFEILGLASLNLRTFPDFLRNQSELRYLDLSDNQIQGKIPMSIFNLRSLTNLYLSSNNFSGSFPLDGLQNLRDLSYLDLSHNSLLLSHDATNLSYSYFPQFEQLWLASLNLRTFPDFLRNQSELRFLDLSDNQIQGKIPMSIFNLRSLTNLYLSSNNFNGSFPLDGLQNLRDLSYLDLSHNSLLLSHDATNLSYSYFPQFEYLGLASLNLRAFPDFLRNQSELRSLDLSDNQIQGKIPNWIWRFNNLYFLNLSSNFLETLEGHTINLTSIQFLDLHSNKLHGEIPISSSPNMIYLDYSRNNFSSTIPTTIGDMLLQTRFFYVASNNLQGIIPGSICNSLYLEVLDLSNNSLSGTIPHCLTTMSTLSVLNLRRNNLRSIDMLSHNCSLHTLDISENLIQSQFLKSLVNCPQLEVLNLGKNQITGPFPCFLKNISTLRVLILQSNKFYGGIGCPKINGTWPMLQIIDLAHNNFSGNVPGIVLTTWQAMMANEDDASSKLNHLQFQDNNYNAIYQDTVTITIKGYEIELIKILTVFTSIDFSCNKFNGSIPYEIGELKSLHILNLSNNAFTGAIPPLLSNLSQLESLDLSQNTLSGQIPLQLTKLTFLSFLNLSHNQLVGRIPSSNQFPTFPKSSFEGNKNLFGPPLTEENRTRLSTSATKGSHPSSGDEIDWNIIIVEIGFTCGFGIAIGSLLFCKRWRKWYYRAMYNILVKIFPQLEHRFGHHRRHAFIGERYWRR